MKRAALAIFLAFFALYLWTMPPTLASYRDAGEFAVSAWSLGVSHPPSYPVYVLLGRAAELLMPLGDRAYALALLSAVSGAACLAALFLAAGPLFGAGPALAGALLLGLNVTFWVVSGVQEMYTLTLLFAAVLLGLSLRLRRGFDGRLWCALWLFYGLFLGNRTDLLLWLPGVLLLAWPAGTVPLPAVLSGRGPRGSTVPIASTVPGAYGPPGTKGTVPLPASPRWLLLRAAGFGLLGLCVYLYLPLRSMQGPWLDWNHPADLYNFVGSLTRRGYGGTLDLLSKSYAPGSMFLPNLRVYAEHLWLNFGPLGAVLTGAGLLAAFRADRRRLASCSLLYAASGPFFLFMANMPPNPHAMAVVEPHYLLSDLVLALWACEGAALLLALARIDAPLRAAAAAAALSAALIAQAAALGHYGLADRRWDLVGHDSAGNILRSLPPGATIVGKKDVQLFSLWYAQRVAGRRPDVRVVAQGLSHSPWYKASHSREGSPLSLGPLREADDWKRFSALNGPGVYASLDADVPPGVPLGPPIGLAIPVLSTGTPSEHPWEFLVRRGDYRYERRPDFFSSDLVNDHSLARQRLGTAFLDAGADEPARRNLLAAWSMKRRFPEAGMFLAFQALRGGDLRRARAAYELTDALFEETLSLTKEYRSLPEVAGAIALSAADSRLNLGVVCERLSDPSAAERAYLRALEANPRAARAHYNLAVLYWNKDWGRVATELEAALRIDPGYADAAKYLAAAKAKAGGK